MIKNVLIITTAFAAGATVSYVGGSATAQASIPLVAPYSPDEVQVTGLATDPTSPKGIINKWVKDNILAPVETARGVTAGTMKPCKVGAVLTVRYIPVVAGDLSQCNVYVSSQLQLPLDTTINSALVQ